MLSAARALPVYRQIAKDQGAREAWLIRPVVKLANPIVCRIKSFAERGSDTEPHGTDESSYDHRNKRL
jgi:hypothetical protein